MKLTSFKVVTQVTFKRKSLHCKILIRNQQELFNKILPRTSYAYAVVKSVVWRGYWTGESVVVYAANGFAYNFKLLTCMTAEKCIESG